MLVFCSSWHDGSGIDLDIDIAPVEDGKFAGRIFEGKFGTYWLVYVGF